MRVALIGSRKAPRKVLDLMISIGENFSNKGYLAYSGGAPGSDEAWLAKYDRTKSLRIIPYNGFCGHTVGLGVVSFENLPADVQIVSYRIAQSVTPYWENCSDIVRKLFARNVCQVLGLTCQDPVDLVLYWAPVRNGRVKGGTRVAVDIAKKYGIKCINLNNSEVFKKFEEKYRPKFDIFNL